jgi:hypothetical protein
VTKRSRALAAVAVAICLVIAGCGLDIESPDLFALTRTGQGQTLTLIVNDSGTIRCNGSGPKPIPDAVLIQARDLSDGLAKDAGSHLTIPSPPGTVSTFTIRMQQGTIHFPDRAAATHHELARAELFAVQADQQACRAKG